MTSKELIKKIRRIEIISNKLAEEIFSGEYRSGFRGRGMEFEDIREYYPGDDVRNIDWNVTARHNKAYIKQFEEERELNVFLLIDMSHSNSFGKKMELIAQLGATLAFSAIRNNDKVGMLLFTEKVEKYIQSKSGKKHVLSIIENILDFKPELKGTNLSNALQHFNRIEKKRSVIFLISDFLDQGFEKDLKITSKHHDLVLIHIVDRAEEVIPQGAVFTFEDLETGEIFVLDNTKNQYKTKDHLDLPKSNYIKIYTDEDFVKPLKQFFKRRSRR
ncbi:MAG TPA: DUF58 domain-containing protein [Ruminiclostridium sp.]|jgi:uncharacterized protein (DUF58 family)|uniref:DUF58 domain-containing protein n=1 Tax=Acetivibrio saccincola TaxID=1677857 RepID=A0A2K9EHN5_9FIRM|nr:DUF58 domain-containing protein [Acetivibrio saccincola]HAA42567.1 DUF58 domain-containing protein [Ruminiclostridium sp.]AUG58725.1 hypothetical protein HVS_14320 [Acetivibrio saccincola]NLW27705.1 DUF58 domain-containing protein [Acetivibrio saccincola]PQQ66174.1 DUF58 domain-containing protein [Acetivibrio saccincola]HOA96348.1 DUF58 domain-containing protein [Acetivibrio saccincola]